MFSPALEKQRRQLYDQTVDQMGRQVQSVTEPAAMLAALRRGMREMDRAHAETSAKVRFSVACRAGCAHCCSGLVDVQAHEVFLAADHIQTYFSPDDLARVIEQSSAHRERIAAFGRQAGKRPPLPCALLRDNQCSIYADRPEACRAHHTSDAAVCAAHLADPAINIDAVYVPTLRARLFAVMLGIDEALEAEGFDDQSYDFGSALHEALTNSLCRVLWLRRKRAFPDSCLADAPG